MLITNSGQEFKGTVSKIREDSVTISTGDEEIVFDKGDLLRIEFAQTIQTEKIITLSDLGDEVLSESVANRVSIEEYPNAGYVKLLDEVEYTLTAEGKFESKKRVILQVLKERGKDAGVATLHYRMDTSDADVLHGRTVNSDVVFDYDRTSLRETSLYYRYPEYDRVKKISFPLPNIVVGSIIDYSYSVTQQTIDTFNPIYKTTYFIGREPIKTKRLVFRYPKSDEVRIKTALKYMGEAGSDYTYRQEDDGDYIVLTYEARNIKAVESESYMPSYAMIMPQVIISISPDFKSIVSEYSAALKERLIITDEMQAKVGELTSGSKSVEIDILNIYRYIAEEIAQVPVSFRHFDFLPGSSDKIFNKKSGNNLEKTFLLYAFLRAAEIPCELALVKRRGSGDIIKTAPSIKQFGAPVVVIPLDTTTLYISALNKSLKITDIDGSIQGGRGLVVSKEGGEIIDIPLKPAEEENTYSSFTIDLKEDGSIHVKEIKRASGNGQRSLRMFKYMPKKRLDQFFLSAMHDKHPNAELVSYEFRNLDDLTKTPEMEVEYIIKDYMITAGGKLFAFQLPSLSYSAYGVGKAERKYPLDFGRLMSVTNEYTLKLPEEYRIYYLPEVKSFESDDFVYESSFKAEGNLVKFKDFYKRNSAYAEKAAYAVLKECLETRAAITKEWIVIEKE